MRRSNDKPFIIAPDDPILVTGAAGFIGARVVADLVARGFRNVRCLVRSSTRADQLRRLASESDCRIELFTGNLLSQDVCVAATKGVPLVIHLAAGRGEKSFADAFLNSVVTTRNLLQATAQHGCLKRFVSVSSFAVYSNGGHGHRAVLDEKSPVHAHPESLSEAYAFAKVKQDEIVTEYGKQFGIPYVIVRPGWVYGPGNPNITGRVGLGTFGIFLHLGGSNPIPATYVDNCAAAIALAGLVPGIEGEVFNVVDDNLYSSRQFLRLYKRQVKNFKSIYLPHALSYMFCSLWERYSAWSERQLPPTFNRQLWRTYWKKTRYSNEKLKIRLGWVQDIPTKEALALYFKACLQRAENA